MKNLIIKFDEDGTHLVPEAAEYEMAINLHCQYAAWRAAERGSSKESQLWNGVIAAAEEILEDDIIDFDEVTDVVEDEDDETAPSPAPASVTHDAPATLADIDSLLLEGASEVCEWEALLKQNYPDMSGLLRGIAKMRTALDAKNAY